MAALIVLAGYVGVRGMAAMRESLALYESDALGVSHIKQANVDLLATQNAVRAALLDEAADKWRAELRKRDASSGAIRPYRETVSNPEDLAKAKDWRRSSRSCARCRTRS